MKRFIEGFKNVFEEFYGGVDMYTIGAACGIICHCLLWVAIIVGGACLIGIIIIEPIFGIG